MKVGIIGAGIGGLTAALSLIKQGVDVHVFEQADAVSEIGAGVQISPNASRVLHGLGLENPLARTGVKPLAWHQRRWNDGQTLLRTPLALAMEAHFGFPHYQMHRADVVDALAGALPAARLHTGHRFAGLVDHGDRVDAQFENGVRFEADALIGADGIHSAVRREVFGPEEARFTGCVAYRGLVPAERLAQLQLEVTAQVWMGPGRHFVHYFVRNRELVNFVAVVDQSDWALESWTTRADGAEASAAFAAWHPQVRTILETVDQTYKWALFDRQPMSHWSAGRVTLLNTAS
jgi:salicylate hydroxylase